jgi:hypothetical protein
MRSNFGQLSGSLDRAKADSVGRRHACSSQSAGSQLHSGLVFRDLSGSGPGHTLLAHDTHAAEAMLVDGGACETDTCVNCCHWYPRAKAHKPRYLAPYVKGPQDKPLKPPSSQLFVAKR